MILLKDASILDGVPRIIAGQTQAKAIAYAFSRQMAQVLGSLDATRTWTDMDGVPESVLDILAVELHVQEYSQSFPITRKRALVKGAFDYWAHAGSVDSVTRVLDTTFGGDAQLQAWYEYGGEPGYFRISTDSPLLDEDALQSFIRMANAIKRLSAWLEAVNVNLTMPASKVYQGAVLERHAIVSLISKRIEIEIPKIVTMATASVSLQRFAALYLVSEQI